MHLRLSVGCFIPHYRLLHYFTEINMNTIGDKIRKIREIKDLKQDDVADRIGISSSAYGKLERDETNITHERLEQIAKVFDLSVSDILAFDEKQVFNFINSQNSGNHNTYNLLSEDSRKLYEDKILLLEEKIVYLVQEIERLKK